MLNEDGEVGTEAALFQLLEQLPISSITAVVAIIVITIFFITSGDSGSLVTDVLAYGGRTETPKLTRVFWTGLIALSAIVLLAAGEDPSSSLRVLQVAAIASAAPFSIVMVLAMFSQVRLYVYEGRTVSRYARIRRHATKAALVEAARNKAGAEEGPAVQRTLIQMLNEQTRTLKGMFGATSATLSGLPTSAGKPTAEQEGIANNDMVLAIQDIPAHATQVDAETGVLGWDPHAAYVDPIHDTTFDTPEFSSSYVGWEQAAEEYFDETVATGSVPTVDSPEETDIEKDT